MLFSLQYDVANRAIDELTGGIYTPTIMTEKEYSEKLELQRKEKFKREETLDYLILNQVDYYINEYVKDCEEDTPCNALINKYSEQELTDPEVLAHYKKTEEERKINKEEWDFLEYVHTDLVCIATGLCDKDSIKMEVKCKIDKMKKESEPRKWDKTDLLYDVLFFYHSEEKGVNIAKFRADYPELFNLLLEEIKTLQKKGLPIKENLDTLPLDKYSEVVLTYKDLYKAGVGHYVKEIGYLDAEHGLNITVTKSPHAVDKKGYYANNQPVDMIKMCLDGLFIESKVFKNLAEIDSKRDFTLLGVLETELKQGLASYTLVKLCDELTDMDLTVGIADNGFSELRTNIFDYNKEVMFYFERLSDAVKAGYSPIYIDKLMPSKERVSKVKKKLKEANQKEQIVSSLLDELQDR